MSSELSFTLDGELYDSSVFTKRVDGMAGEEAGVLSHCWHDLEDAEGENTLIIKWCKDNILLKDSGFISGSDTKNHRELDVESASYFHFRLLL